MDSRQAINDLVQQLKGVEIDRSHGQCQWVTLNDGTRMQVLLGDEPPGEPVVAALRLAGEESQATEDDD